MTAARRALEVMVGDLVAASERHRPTQATTRADAVEQHIRSHVLVIDATPKEPSAVSTDEQPPLLPGLTPETPKAKGRATKKPPKPKAPKLPNVTLCLGIHPVTRLPLLSHPTSARPRERGVARASTAPSCGPAASVVSTLRHPSARWSPHRVQRSTPPGRRA